MKAVTQKRALFDTILRGYDQSSRSGIILTEGYMYLIGRINAVTAQFRFDVLNTDQANGPQKTIERRLNITDNFHAYHIGAYLMKPAIAGATANDAELLVTQEQTWSNPTVFGASATNINAFYNGNIRIAINSKVWYEALDLKRFKRISTSQQGNGPALAIQHDEWNAPNYGMHELTPSFTLLGQGKNEISLQFPVSTPTFAAAAGSETWCAILIRGFLAQNAAKVRLNSDVYSD